MNIKKKKLRIRGFIYLYIFIYITAPKYTDDQNKRVKSWCRRVYRKMLENTRMDDETYVPRNSADITVRKYFHSSNLKKC